MSNEVFCSKSNNSLLQLFLILCQHTYAEYGFLYREISTELKSIIVKHLKVDVW